MKRKIIILPLPAVLNETPKKIIGNVNVRLTKLVYLLLILVFIIPTSSLMFSLYEAPLLSLIFLPVLVTVIYFIKCMFNSTGYFEVDEIGLRYRFGKKNDLVNINWDSIKKNSKVSVQYGSRHSPDKLTFSYWSDFGLTE